MFLLDIIKAIGVGILLIPFTVISIICLKKTKKTALNDGLLWASFIPYISSCFYYCSSWYSASSLL